MRLLAFDDDLNLAAGGKSGSVNPNFESDKKISENMSEAARTLLSNLGGGWKIKKIYATIVGSTGFFREIFFREAGDMAKGAAFCDIPEGYSHLFASSLTNKGGVALSGTGSGAIYCNAGKILHMGGYGIPVGDEGSGAWIGMQAISAAIKYINGWGQRTSLAEKLYEYLGINSPGAITGALYKKDTNQRGLFAGFAPCAAECERAGDGVAKEIIYRAGNDMALQMIALLKRAESGHLIDTAKEAPTIYASGGAWKGTPYMFEAMEKTMRGVYPSANCAHGLFDPVVGGVVKFIFDKTGECAVSGECEKHMKKEFKDYMFNFD